MTGSPAASNSWIATVRAALAEPRPARLRVAPGGELRAAAVLVPLYVDASELWTVLTRRNDALTHHPGQVAFPGGSLDPGEDAWTAALREAHEEVGLLPRQVLRLGELDEADVPSGFRIVPCVGAVPSHWQPQSSAAEIAEVFRLPLSAFTQPRLIEDRQVTFNGVRREVRVYHVGSRQIWGVTARILQTLLARLGADGPVEED